MIQHAVELWVAIAACFLLGSLVGSLLHRTIALTGAARWQAHLVHGVDRAIRVMEWRVMPWRTGGPVPLPRVASIPPPDFSHAEPVPVVPPQIWEDTGLPVGAPSLEPVVARSVFDDERLREAVDRGDAAGTRPVVLAGPRHGSPDELTAIRGLGKRHAARLAAIGIYHFSQIAAWTPQEVAWIGAFLDIGDAVRERDWVGQATRVAGSDDPEAAIRTPPKKPPKQRAKRGKAKKTPAGQGAEPLEPQPAETPADEPVEPGSVS
ncbi:MAG: hypothetical protein J0H11_15520 [Rhizobiales bacterium]|nr:hypothetical protein [Hyphomicrobiales bacterium]